MLNSFIVSVNAVVPMFLLLALGYTLRQINFVSEEYLKVTNKLTFKIFLPLLLFNNIYKTQIADTFDSTMFLFAVGSFFLLCAILCLAVPRIIKNPRQQGVIIQGIFRSNYVIFGVTLVSNVFGPEETAAASVLSAVLVPLYNVMAVIVLAVYTSGEKADIKNTVKSIMKNPLIIASVIGVLASFAHITLPTFLATSVNDLAKLATPLALISLGGEFSFASLRGNIKIAAITVFIKLVVVPVVFIPFAVLAGIRGSNLLALALAWETPIAVSSYIMAQQAGGDDQLAGQLVVLSTAGSIITVFMMIFILKNMALL